MSATARTAHASLVATLHRLRNRDGGWPYYGGRHSRLESTCWAVLGTGVSLDSTPLAGWGSPDGLLVEPSSGEVNFGFNGLAALVMSAPQLVTSAVTRRIVSALIEARGVAVSTSPVIRQDTSLQAWSWTRGTFSWVDPTAWCMLALKRWPGLPEATRARVAVAEEVLRDRVCPGGGWNFGNGEVYGQGLPAHVPTTAAGVLALQDRSGDPLVQSAVAFLERAALLEGSTTALALSALALASVGRPSSRIVAALGAHAPASESFGNIAALGMAAYALDCAAHGVRPPAFALRTETRQ